MISIVTEDSLPDHHNVGQVVPKHEVRDIQVLGLLGTNVVYERAPVELEQHLLVFLEKGGVSRVAESPDQVEVGRSDYPLCPVVDARFQQLFRLNILLGEGRAPLF